MSCSPQFFQIQIFELQSLNKGKQISGGQSPLNINKEKIVKEKKAINNHYWDKIIVPYIIHNWVGWIDFGLGDGISI